MPHFGFIRGAAFFIAAEDTLGSHSGGGSLPKRLEVNFSLPTARQWLHGCGGQWIEIVNR
jgi:hypothetical protein